MALQVEDEADYAAAVQELSSGILREGLWANALVEADGDRDQAKVAYLRHRVALIKEEKKLAAEERTRREQAEAEEAKTLESIVVSTFLSACPRAKSLTEDELKRFAARHAKGEDVAEEVQREVEKQRWDAFVSFSLLAVVALVLSWLWVFVVRK